MNERIKELWDTAAKLESDPSWEGQTKFIEKFAELIVLECAKRSEELGQPELGKGLMKHFGVE
jgi:hypothetical protein